MAPGVGLYRDEIQSAAGQNRAIGRIVLVVAHIQTGRIQVERNSCLS